MPGRRRTRLVRLHLLDVKHSIEGLCDLRLEAGHYVLRNPKVWETAESSRELGTDAFVPRERVDFIQVLG